MNPESPKQIDYSALSLPVSQLHLGTDVNWLKSAKACGVLLLLLGPPLYQSSGGNLLETGIGLVELGLIIMGVVGIVWTVQRLFPTLVSKKRLKQTRLKRFAEMNGFQPLADADILQSGMQFVDNGTTEYGFRTQNMEIGNYAFYISPRGGWHRFGYIRLRLSREVSQIVFDAKVNNSFGWTNLAESFADTLRVPIDVEFDALYNVYAPSGYEQTARDLARQFRPVLVKDGAAAYDMECVAYDIYLYRTEPFEFTEASVRELLGMAEELEAVGREVDVSGGERMTPKRAVPVWLVAILGAYVALASVGGLASTWGQEGSERDVLTVVLFVGASAMLFINALRKPQK